MIDGYCRFVLIYPPWLAWVVLGVGAVLLGLGVWRLATLVASGQFTFPNLISFSNIFPFVLFVCGLGLFTAGVGGLAALDHQPFARWAVGVFPALLAEGDAPVAADFNNKPLSEIVSDGDSGHYVIRLSPAARNLRISGAYPEAFCDADLLNRICRNNGDKLTCADDPLHQILRICAKSNDAACRDHTL
jgi:hypothetical protein